MSRQSKRITKAAIPTIPDADIMRTILKTIIAVLAAILLVQYTDAKSAIVYNQPETPTIQQVAQKPVTAAASVPETPAIEQAQPDIETLVAATCAGEIEKYSWDTGVAHSIMVAESGGNVDTHNDDISTGDYSIGCFQINLLGTNLGSKYRIAVTVGYGGDLDTDQLTAWLKNPVNNVAVAHQLYTINGGWMRDWEYTCTHKVQCY